MAYSPFPESFLFGVANADHQVEAYDPAYKDVRDEWDERRNLQLRGQAADFWNRYPEDIRLAKEMGCKAFRFSIAWARVEPEVGQFHDENLAHYHNVVTEILAAGMEPVVTLHHFTWPLHVEQRGGMINDDFPNWFAQYAKIIARRFGDQVRYWITFNELNQLVYGYFKLGDYLFPPGLPPNTSNAEQMEKVRLLIRNLFKSHTRARAIIKQYNPDAQVGVNPWFLGLPAWSRWFINRKVTHLTEEDWAKQGQRFTEQSPLWNREVDIVVANLTITPERSQQVDFSEIYYTDELKLLVKSGSTIQGPQSLVGRRVAVVKSSRAERAILTLIPGADDQVTANHAEAVKLLESNQVTAILADASVLQGIVDQNPGRYDLVGEKLSQEHYAVAVGKGNPALLDVVDVAVRQFRTQLLQSYQKHLPNREPSPQPTVPTRVTLSDLNGSGSDTLARKLPLAEEETWLRKIQDRGYLRAAVKDNVPGFGYRNPQTGELSGLEIDLARDIAELIFGDRSKIQFRPVTTQQRIPCLRSLLQVFDPILRGASTLSTIFNSNWWHLGMAGKLPEFLCPSGCVGQQDFVGFDYYWGVDTFSLNKLGQLRNALGGDSQNSPVWPGGFYALLKEHAKLFPDQDIMIIENGCVVEADGVKRKDYISRHLQQIQRARQEGAKIVSYLCWSITTNREWGLKLGPGSDFGLYKIDLDRDPHLTRVETEDVVWFKAVIKRRGV